MLRTQTLALLSRRSRHTSITDIVDRISAVSLSTSGSENEQLKYRFQRGWDRVKDSFKTDSSHGSGADFQKTADKVWQEVKDAVLPRTDNLSATRVRTDTTPLSEASFQLPSHIVQAKKKETLFSRMAERLHNQLEGNPVYMRLRGWTTQGKEMAEDFKDRIESSDHPMMHKIQAMDYRESFNREGEPAQVMRVILERDPSFNLVNFLRSVREDVPVVVKAYLEGKKDVLRQHCTDELLERLLGLYKHSESQGMYQDSTLLFINEVERMDEMFVENRPVIVVTFSCQQINCMRDKFGNVIEGKEDEIQQVYYAWALQQDEQGALDGDGKLLPPRWQLREMMIRGFHALL